MNSGTHLRRCNGCELDIAKRVDARYVLIGWIYKVSTLVLTLHVDIKDVETGKPVYARVFDFRGDNERAYAHAGRTLVRSLKEERARAGASSRLLQEPVLRPGSTAPIKIAVFDFELEDFSAAGVTVPGTERHQVPGAGDRGSKARARPIRPLQHREHRRRRPGGSARSWAAQLPRLRREIAAKLGAEQDMVGVVTKISMTEYTVTVQVSDVRKGTVIKTYTTGLRMGAGYSWVRGVTWLMKNRVLASSAQ